MRLCRELGIQHPDFLEIDDEQLADWLAFHELEPFGQPWLQTGQVAAAAHNAVIVLGRLLGCVDETALKKLWQRATDFMPQPPQKRKPPRLPRKRPWEEDYQRLRYLLRC